MATGTSAVNTTSCSEGPEDQYWQAVSEKDGIPSHHVYTKTIQKSESDTRDYRLIRLENGLEAVLIHDSTADKAAACLKVNVGHMQDPDDMPGLAHFCEHLLFMGTEQFPKENEYKDYLQKNNGDANAYTGNSETCYFFDVSADAFKGALERFSGFFHCPLFSPSSTNRELYAVDSEHKKNLQSDMWRLYQLGKSLSKEGHPYSKFGTGDVETLTQAAKELSTNKSIPKVDPSGRVQETTTFENFMNPSHDREVNAGDTEKEVRRRLIQWWENEYCAGRMSLVLVGKESIDILTKYATVLFSPILNRGLDSMPKIEEYPYGTNETGILILAKNVTDTRCITLRFPIPYVKHHWRCKPEEFISHVIGHEGEGSLHAFLKEKGWITYLCACHSHNMARAFSALDINIELTKEGLRHYRVVALACFKLINLLRASDPPEWHHNERKELSALEFRFQEKTDSILYATTIANSFELPAPRNLLLTAPALVWDWDSQSISDLLDGMTAESCQIFIRAQNFDEIGIKGPWEHEKWYKTEYKSCKLDTSFINETKQPNDVPDLHLCKPNEFIPHNFDVDVGNVNTPIERPVLLSQTVHGELWHKKDDQFKIPRAQVNIEFRTPVAGASVRASVMTVIFVDLVNDYFNKHAYNAGLAGLNYFLRSHALGFTVTVWGYNDKLHILLRNLLVAMKELEIRPRRLAVIKEELKQYWENVFLGRPSALSMRLGEYMMCENEYDLVERISVIEGITKEELQQHIDDLLTQYKYKALVNGNVKKEEALSIKSLIAEVLKRDTLSYGGFEDVYKQSRLIPSGCNFVWNIPVSNPNELNGSVMHFCHVGGRSNPRLRTVFKFLLQIIEEPAFDILRTKEQLGYLVQADGWFATEFLGLRIVVQSVKHPQFVESRIEAFLGQMVTMIESMDDSTFEDHRKALVSKWTEKLKNLNEETNRFWDHIETGYLDFYQLSKDSVILRTVTKQEILSLFSKYICPSSKCRSKFSVHLQSQKAEPLRFTPAAGKAFISFIGELKISVDEKQFLELCANEPSVDDVKSFCAKQPRRVSEEEECGVMEQRDLQEAHSLLDKLAVRYASGEAGIEVSQDVVNIKDHQAFKKTLQLSGAAKPLDVFYDLPTTY